MCVPTGDLLNHPKDGQFSLILGPTCPSLPDNHSTLHILTMRSLCKLLELADVANHVRRQPITCMPPDEAE